MSQAGLSTTGEDNGIKKWFEITVTGPTAMIKDYGYIANTTSPTLCQFTLPTTADVGSIVAVVGKGTGLFQIQQGALQQIHYGNLSTTVGPGGSITSTKTHDRIELLCTTDNTTWTVLSAGAVLNVV